jgi:tetratricopeptide (TPR) repeat protein
MLPYLKTGRLAEAVDAHRRAYRVQRSRLADLGDIAWHMAFCARTGNEHRGLEILQRHLDWLDRAPSPFSAMSFATYGSHVLRRVAALGRGDVPLRRKDRDDTTAAELAEELAAMATGIAARFDARNGTDAQTRWVAEQLDAEPYGVDLILDPAARQTRPARQPARESEPTPEVPAEWSVEQLLDLAEEHHRAERDEALAGVVDALEKRAPAPGDPLLEARRLRALGYRAAAAKRDDALGRRAAAKRDDALDLWMSAADRFASAGAAGEASSLRARVALERAYAGEVDDAPIRDNVAYQEQHGDARERAIAYARLAFLHVLRGEFAEANEAGDRGDDHAGQTGDPRLIATHAMLRARNRAAEDRDEEAVAAARQSYEFYREHGPARRLAEAATVLGHAVEDPAERVELFGVVLDTGDPDHALPARVGRGHALKQLGRPGEAVVDLAEAVALCAEQRLEPGGAFARYELAEAYARDERPVEAVEVAEEALLFFDREGERRAGDNTRYLLAQQYRRLGDTDAALARYRELIERLTDNPHGRAQMGEEAGAVLFDLDRDADAAEAFGAAATCLHDVGDLVAELRLLRRRVAALHFAGDVEAAEAAIRLAGERWAELPPELAAEPEAIWHHSMTMWEAGRVLMSRGRCSDALPHLRGADAALRAIGATDDADRLAGMYGEALLRSGSPADAEPVMRQLLDGMAPDAAGRETAEKVYAEIVEALGKS